MLTDGCRADSVPNLEIETGEIEGAGHASTTGRFDDEQLFYLRSRGIDEAEARRLVVHGFFADIIRKVGVPEIEKRLLEAVEAELAINSRTAIVSCPGSRLLVSMTSRRSPRIPRRGTAEIGERLDLAIVHSSGAFYAIADECSHAPIPLSEGDVGDGEIECYLHGSRFDLRTGEPIGLPATEPVADLPLPRRGRRRHGRCLSTPAIPTRPLDTTAQEF